ncbi:hypothetical protein ACHAXS_013644 [Conticribra weissflogii]
MIVAAIVFSVKLFLVLFVLAAIISITIHDKLTKVASFVDMCSHEAISINRVFDWFKIAQLVFRNKPIEELTLFGYYFLGDSGARYVADLLDNFEIVQLTNLSTLDDLPRNSANMDSVLSDDLVLSRRFVQDDASLERQLTGSNEQCSTLFSHPVVMQALRRNSSLEKLTVRVGSKSFRKIISTIWDLVCDASSFESLCHSNHNLSKVEIDVHHDDDSTFDNASIQRLVSFDRALAINEKRHLSIHSRMILKLKQIYFRQPDLPMGPFHTMKPSVVPLMMALFTKGEDDEEGSLNAVYRIMKQLHLPELSTANLSELTTSVEDVKT